MPIYLRGPIIIINRRMVSQEMYDIRRSYADVRLSSVCSVRYTWTVAVAGRDLEVDHQGSRKVLQSF